MKLKETLVLDSMDPLSKAAAHLQDCETIIVTKNGKYCGIIDRRSIAGQGIKNAGTAKCETVVLKSPALIESSSTNEAISAFLLGHFRTLPVLDGNDEPLGVTSRIDVLDELRVAGKLPVSSVSELMSSPVYTILATESIAKAKNIMKEKGVGRLLVVNATGFPSGVIWAFDVAQISSRANFSSGHLDLYSSSQAGAKIDNLSVSEFARPDFATLEDSSTLAQATEKMLKNRVSEVVVLSNKKPVGVLSVLDIFKKAQEIATSPPAIVVSGLGKENANHYEYIQKKFAHALSKFDESFNISYVSLHVKEDKSTFELSLFLETGQGHLSIKEERESLDEAVDALVAEMTTLLRKKKDQRKVKPRATHGGLGDE